ncbi:hypothetical protein [Paenibacillus hamazuiensis]|uniref:hypothetical protein n=1 Tax=Paenibacillus hamazuiensis TaxID=2936508 RepID=UPI002010A781|nr:hypothetical protein [Paenibacillus hamazuiensis]
MGWSELRLLPSEYNDAVKQIDQKLLELIVERKTLAGGKRFSPPKELIRQWAETYEIPVPQINWLLHRLNEGDAPVFSDGPGELLNVISIMKKTTVDGFEYVLTHSMQHENGSMVHLDIRQIRQDARVHVRPHLHLEITGAEPYNVHRHGSHGGGGQAHLNFFVTPRLPEDVSELVFSLIPFAMPMDTAPKEVILDKEVRFGDE